MDLSSFQIKKQKSRIYTPDQSLAEQIWFWLDKKLPFPRVMRIIKLIGHGKAYQVMSEIKQSDCRDALSLFIYKTKKKNL